MREAFRTTNENAEGAENAESTAATPLRPLRRLRFLNKSKNKLLTIHRAL